MCTDTTASYTVRKWFKGFNQCKQYRCYSNNTYIFLNNNYVLQEDYKYLKPCGSKPGIMYGLCKFHKFNPITRDVSTFQPILSIIGISTYNLANFLYQFLKNTYTFNEYTAHDSFSFCKEIRKQDLSLHMSSFDIQSLFTNIILYETIDICVKRVFQHHNAC